MIKLFRIEGFSLFPLLKEGEVVLCTRVFFFSKIKLNDFILFNHKTEGLMIKKVTNINNGKYFLKGETPFSIDSRNFGELNKNELLFKVIFKLPFNL
jgi:hypothetical protein